RPVVRRPRYAELPMKATQAGVDLWQLSGQTSGCIPLPRSTRDRCDFGQTESAKTPKRPRRRQKAAAWAIAADWRHFWAISIRMGRRPPFKGCQFLNFIPAKNKCQSPDKS